MSGQRCTISGVVATLLVTAGWIASAAYLLRNGSQQGDGEDGTRRANERRAYLNVLAIAKAQEAYREQDWDGDGIKMYTPFIAHLWQAVDGEGRPVKTRLIPRPLAFAMDPEWADEGYYYRLFYRRGPPDKPRLMDYQKEWAVIALPAVPRRTGRLAFLCTQERTVFAQPIAAGSMRYPLRPDQEGWTTVDSLANLNSLQEAIRSRLGL